MASFNETFDFANFDQEKFDSYRHLRDEKADTLATFIINSPHYSQVYQALSKIIKNNDLITLELFSDIIRDRNTKINTSYTVPTAGVNANAASDDAAGSLRDAHTIGQRLETEAHNQDDCKTDADHEQLVTALNEYFNDQSLFDFIEKDPGTVDLGNDVFNFYYVHCTFALGVRSLMKQYAAYNATQVLKFTKLIYDLPYRRIMETVQFVMDVMDPAGFTPTGCAIRSIQKLRLVHAMIRVRIDLELYDQNPKKDQVLLGPWKAEEWGEPINQQDMIFAVHTFSVEVIDALVDIGEFNPNNPTNRKSMEAYYLLWHYIGRALGTMDEINPTNYADGKKLQQIIYAKQFNKTKSNADILVKPLVGFLAKLLSVKHDRKVYSLVRYYNRGPQDRETFKNIIKINLVRDSSKVFYFFIYGGFLLAKIIFTVVLWFIPKEEQNKKAHALFALNYDLLGKIIYVASGGDYATGKHFRVADGFGLPAPVINYQDYENQPSFMSSFLKMVLKKLWHAAKDFISNLFKKK